jgi:D-alanyl-D-alanine carboxypeptidase (penicillin-binding protein 5/6)
MTPGLSGQTAAQAPVDETRATPALRRAIVALVLVAALLGTLAAFIIPSGLPYDEPAHWANVEYVRTFWSLPVLGDTGVGYEGQQAPLYYVLAALIAGAAGQGSFVAVRLFSVVGFAVLTWLTAVILASIARRHTLVVVGGTAFVAFNPMLIAMSATVQNDTWALVWGFGAIALAMRPVGERRWLRGALVGLLVSLAILTKLTMAPLLIGLMIAYALRRRVVEPLVSIGVVAVVTGWWFVRNLLLYGDLTGQSAVARTGAVFENAPSGPFALARTILTYLTLPTEYFRNTIAAPVWVDACAIAVGALLLVGIAMIIARGRRDYSRWELIVVSALAVSALVAWFAQVQFGWPVAFRAAYVALPFFALAAGTATRIAHPPWGQWAVIAAMSALQLATGVWVAAALLGADIASQL